MVYFQSSPKYGGHGSFIGWHPLQKKTVSSSRFIAIESVIRQTLIKVPPDNPAWRPLFTQYVANHMERLCLDLIILESVCSADHEILEVGAIPPVVTLAAKELALNLTGLDIDPERFSECIRSQALNILKCDIEHEAMPFDDHKFHIIVMNEVFEHLRIDLIYTMREIFRILRPGGLLIVSTPNLYSWRGILNFLVKKRAYAIEGNPYKEFQTLQNYGNMGHIREYTPLEVNDFMMQIGFNPRNLLFRGKATTKVEKIITTTMPSLLPFFTLIMEKPV